MLCKIASTSQQAEPVAWRSVGPNARPPSLRALLNGAAIGGVPQQGLPAGGEIEDGEANAEQARLVDIERARQVQLAQTHQTGLQEGLRQGREEATSEIQRMIDETATIIDGLAKVKRKVRSEAEGEVVKLAIAIARRILYRELSTDPESIEGIVHAALQKLQQREVARVRVYPAGAAAVRAALLRIGSRNAIEVVADGSLSVGGILFETSMGDLDGSIETQLQEIQRGFADRLAIR